jgi:hypothetical protein
MADFDDLSLDRDRRPAPNPIAPEESPRFAPWLIAAIVLLVLALGALWYFVLRSRTELPPKTVAETTVDLPRPPARRTAEPGEAIDLPPLDQSDGVVRTLVERLSSHPAVAAWLTTNGLIRNLTLVIANIADGETPAKHLAPLRPTGSFRTTTSGGLTWIDPASYSRYDAIAAAVDGLDARGVARFYATIKPRIQDANRDLAGKDADFDQTVQRAIVMLLRTPVVDQDVHLRIGKGVSYAFANPALEELTAVQRQFLRMGPRNVRIVKAKLRDVAGFLGIPDSALPPVSQGARRSDENDDRSLRPTAQPPSANAASAINVSPR